MTTFLLNCYVNWPDVLVKPLTIIYKASIDTGIVHQSWKQANVIPIFKSGSKNQVANYRPVSLTSVVCKVLESMIKDCIEQYLIKHDLIENTQHGFVKSRSY